MARHSHCDLLVYGVKRLAFCALLLGACDLSNDTSFANDPKNQNFGFIVETVLKPNCGSTTCHSSFKYQSTDIFDSIDETRKSFNRNSSLVPTCEAGSASPPCPGVASANSYLISVIVDGVMNGSGDTDYMPLDHPMGNAELQLLINWIDNDSPGYVYDGNDQ